MSKSTSSKRQAAIKTIDALSDADKAAWRDVQGTAKVCEYCGSTHYPQDTPDWAEWVSAYDAMRNATAMAIMDGTITLSVAVERWELSSGSLKATIARLAREGSPVSTS
jgi:hypothetical protein